MLILLVCLFFLLPITAFAQSDPTDLIQSELIKNIVLISDSIQTSQKPDYTKDLKEEDFNVFPTGLTTEIDTLLQQWYLNHYVDLDTTCACEDNKELVNDSIYRARLSFLPSLVDMSYNPIVRKYIEVYTQHRRSLVAYTLAAGHFYFPIFEEILDRKGAPIELKYIPIIESALKPTARSPRGATGLWQFMYTTGRSMGLEISSLVDERCDPYKATEAAADYLLNLYETYDDWTLAIAAYNCGPGNINKAIRRAGGKRNFWEIYYYLPRETRGYIPAFIAANYIMNYACEHQICPSTANLMSVSDTLHIRQEITLTELSKSLDMDLAELRLLNPQYRRDVIPAVAPDAKEGRTLRLPILKLYHFIDQENSILKTDPTRYITKTQTPEVKAPAQPLSTTHIVRSGETLGHIAMLYRTSVSSIKRINGLRSDRLRIGQRLTIHGAPSTTRQGSSTSQRIHIVRKGDNLWTIARKYPGISADMIKKENKLRSNDLSIGQRLMIPAI